MEDIGRIRKKTVFLPFLFGYGCNKLHIRGNGRNHSAPGFLAKSKGGCPILIIIFHRKPLGFLNLLTTLFCWLFPCVDGFHILQRIKC